MYEFTEEYVTGIPLIDAEHKELFRIAGEAYNLLMNEFIPDKYDNISAILNELRNYTKKHFKDEEDYMNSIHYKRMFTQKVEHEAFIEKLDSIDMDDVDENQKAVLLDLLDFLLNWLIHHILEKDKLIGQ